MQSNKNTASYGLSIVITGLHFTSCNVSPKPLSTSAPFPLKYISSSCPSRSSTIFILCWKAEKVGFQFSCLLHMLTAFSKSSTMLSQLSKSSTLNSPMRNSLKHCQLTITSPVEFGNTSSTTANALISLLQRAIYLLCMSFKPSHIFSFRSRSRFLYNLMIKSAQLLIKTFLIIKIHPRVKLGVIAASFVPLNSQGVTLRPKRHHLGNTLMPRLAISRSARRPVSATSLRGRPPPAI
ncbi:RNA-binding protein [Trichinella spiralis]|uniref:RNA-binding protein n=1 Tax=Trichinella spiralis TaxID=6334 RepID=UPI0001EFBCB6|nr:RNA-binding protein [Trichinella spiralis]